MSTKRIGPVWPPSTGIIFFLGVDWEAWILSEKPTSIAVGSCGGYARATREHISINDEQKLAALHRIHDILEHVTLQHAFQHQASRTRVKGGAPYDTEIKAAFRSQDLSG